MFKVCEAPEEKIERNQEETIAQAHERRSATLIFIKVNFTWHATAKKRLVL